jgi:uncharacterized membrane protein YqjE
MDFREEPYRTTTVYAESESVADLVKDFRDEMMTLARQEVELAKTEISEKTTKVARDAISISSGALVLYAGFLSLLMAVSGLLFWVFTTFLPIVIAAWLAPLVVGAIVTGIGIYLLMNAQRDLKHLSILPEKTVRSLQGDRVWLRKGK